MRPKSDREWRICNAAIDALRSMAIPLHFSVVGSIVRAHWHWKDTPPTDDQVYKAMSRVCTLDKPMPASPGTIFHRSGGVFLWKPTHLTGPDA